VDIRTGQVIDLANFAPGIELLNADRGEQALRTFKVSVTSGNACVNIAAA